MARAIAANPEVLLMDEPASALEPTATTKLENLIEELRGHSMQQAACVSQRIAFHLGRLLEAGDAQQIFVNPQEQPAQRCRAAGAD